MEQLTPPPVASTQVDPSQVDGLAFFTDSIQSVDNSRARGRGGRGSRGSRDASYVDTSNIIEGSRRRKR